MKIPVVVIFAPTASGKTALAINLFGKGSPSFFNGKAELISADSMQVYRKLDIGTAKPDEKEKSELTHHLIDIRDFDQQFTVSDFVNEADLLCEDIYRRGKIPLVMGGTGFYIRNFLLGLPVTPPSDENLRNKLKERIKVEGKEALYAELKKVDEQSAAKININDEYRILRALEVFYLTGKPRSHFELNDSLREKFEFHTFILEREREELYQRINRRVDIMFEKGLENEVRSLIAEGASKDMPAFQAIGYREWFAGDMTSKEGIEKIKSEIKHWSRKYAKKQYTFMKGIPGANIIQVTSDEECFNQVEQLLLKRFCKNGSLSIDLNLQNQDNK